MPQKTRRRTTAGHEHLAVRRIADEQQRDMPVQYDADLGERQLLTTKLLRRSRKMPRRDAALAKDMTIADMLLVALSHEPTLQNRIRSTEPCLTTQSVWIGLCHH